MAFSPWGYLLMESIARAGLLNHPDRPAESMNPALLAVFTIGNMSPAEFMRPVVQVRREKAVPQVHRRAGRMKHILAELFSQFHGAIPFVL
jgi:hypothetical protein